MKIIMCLLFHRFVPWTGEYNYLDIIRDGGCWSWYGQQGGAQQLSLASGCADTVGSPVHEFMHAIGTTQDIQFLYKSFVFEIGHSSVIIIHINVLKGTCMSKVGLTEINMSPLIGKT